MITVVFHSEPEGCWAESPDIPGFSAAADDFPELRALAEAAILELLGSPVQLDERHDPPVRGTTQLTIPSTNWMSLSGRNVPRSSGTSSGGSRRTHQEPTHPIPTPAGAERP